MNNSIFDFSWVGSAISAAVAAFITWFFSRKKQQAEVDSNEIDNVDKAIKIWRQIASDLEGKFSSLQTKVYELEMRVMTLEKENSRLESENADLKRQNAILKTPS